MRSSDRLTVEEALAGFDEYLRRVRGVCEGMRRNYVGHTRVFLHARFGDVPVKVSEISAVEVWAFVWELTLRYQPKTVELAASALRGFFRYLRAVGLRADRLDEAVPMLPHRTRGLVRICHRPACQSC